MNESLKKKICNEFPDWLTAYEKSDHDNYTPEYWHFEWKTEDRQFEPIADQEWNWLVDQMILKTKKGNSVDYWNELLKIVCEDYDEVENMDSTTLSCMLYATPEQKAKAYFAVLDLLKEREKIADKVADGIKDWKSKFKNHFGNGPVKRKERQ
jgi:hypothetical protein